MSESSAHGDRPSGPRQEISTAWQRCERRKRKRRGERVWGINTRARRGEGVRVRWPGAIGGLRGLPCSPRTSCPRKGDDPTGGTGHQRERRAASVPLRVNPEMGRGLLLRPGQKLSLDPLFFF
jgi:hypothetical protein